MADMNRVLLISSINNLVCDRTTTKLLRFQCNCTLAHKACEKKRVVNVQPSCWIELTRMRIKVFDQRKDERRLSQSTEVGLRELNRQSSDVDDDAKRTVVNLVNWLVDVD
jgi:hypothetical protein